MQVRVHSLNVVQDDELVEQHLVEGHGEAPVNVMAVEDCHSNDSAHKVEVGQMFLEERQHVSHHTHHHHPCLPPCFPHTHGRDDKPQETMSVSMTTLSFLTSSHPAPFFIIYKGSSSRATNKKA